MVYKSDKNILIAPELAFTISATFGDTGITADSNGKKIIPAGTPVGNLTQDVLMFRDAVLIATNDATNGAKSQGVTMHNVDVTAGNATDALVVFGFVDVDKTAVTPDKAVVLPKITFMKGDMN
ncbi:MAG: hypothetical protein RR902_00520 [Oscillospiraceae bacterium]